MQEEIHEVCEIFPMMGPDEYAALLEDIKANGQRQPILTHHGKVIDGRNRLKACREAGITPIFQSWDGSGSLAQFVYSLNLHRRHLTSSQRALCGLLFMDRLTAEAADRKAEGAHKGGVASGESRRGDDDAKHEERIPQGSPAGAGRSPQSRDTAAKAGGTNSRYIQDAKTIRDANPGLLDKVRSGEMTIPQAKREVARTRKMADLEARAGEVVSPASPDWSIVVGDSIALLDGSYDDKVDDYLYDLPCRPGEVRLIFADPPYNLGIDYGEGTEADLRSQREYDAWTRDWVEQAVDWLTPDGSMWVLVNHEAASMVQDALGDFGLTIRSWITWYESFGVNCANNFNRTSRQLFYAVKDPKRFVFNAEAVNRPGDRQAKYGDSRAEPNGKIWDDVWGINPPIPRLVDNAAERIPGFPTQLPLKLLRPIVGCASDPGDLVLDPFHGSGTTGVACIELGRRYVGLEKNPEYAQTSRMRLATTKPEEVRDETE